MKLTLTQQFQDYLKSLGVDFSMLLEKAALLNKTWQEDIVLTDLEYYRLLLAFDDVMTEEAVCNFSRIEHIQLFIPAFFAALSAQNGLEAIERFAHYKHLVGPIDLDVVPSDKTVSVHYRYAISELALPKFAILNEQLLLLNLIRVGTGERITPLAVSSPFDYAESTLLEFGVSVPKSDSNAIVFDKVDLEKPFITQNNVMWQYLESQLNHQLELLNRDNSFSQHVQQTLFSALPRGHFQIEDVAIDLGVSVRTLQRISQQN
ncbi:AraC family transcriptional regulator ligand-binding domain-containing protein [Streptococcus hyointestinalis]|nr:AraC family transcriptional regulator ligand-binding domain-containing protein [Streptococcus hyointestinalis]